MQTSHNIKPLRNRNVINRIKKNTSRVGGGSRKT